ncbi:MAG: hypothetical protein C0623_06580 [Desulfuromonas sp.]|nr:MAG: hypothetical protein C0623_06580 [Desulfuromonas sp.]
MKTYRLLLVLLLVLLSACSMMPNHKDDFTKKNEDFMLRVRWLDFQGASLHFSEELRADFLERFNDVDDLKVTNFTMTRLDIDAPNDQVVVHYLLEYYKLPSVTLSKKRFSLAWEEQASGGMKFAYWRIVEPFPELL